MHDIPSQTSQRATLPTSMARVTPDEDVRPLSGSTQAVATGPIVAGAPRPPATAAVAPAGETTVSLFNELSQSRSPFGDLEGMSETAVPPSPAAKIESLQGSAVAANAETTVPAGVSVPLAPSEPATKPTVVRAPDAAVPPTQLSVRSVDRPPPFDVIGALILDTPPLDRAALAIPSPKP